MSDSEKTPILPTKPPDSPKQQSRSGSPLPPPPAEIPHRLGDTEPIDTGYISRDTFKRVYSFLSIMYGILNVCVWVSLALTMYYLQGTSGYYGAVIALASQMIGPSVQCASIGSRFTSVGYKHATRLGLKTLVNIHLCFLVFQLMSSLACIGVSGVYGIHYGKHGEDEINKDINVGLGILNVALASVVAIVTLVTIYFAVKLRDALSMAVVNSGPFAVDGSYSE